MGKRIREKMRDTVEGEEREERERERRERWHVLALKKECTFKNKLCIHKGVKRNTTTRSA